MWVYIWTGNPLQNAYIGEYTEWRQPWVYHKSSEWLISLSNDWETWYTIADKDVGSTVAGTTSASWWNFYAWSVLPTAPSGYHIPTSTEWQNLMNVRQAITSSNSDDLIMQHLLIPWAWFKTSWGVQSDIWAWLYWSATSYTSNQARWTRFYPTATFMDLFNHNKANQLTVRMLKDTAVEPDNTRTVLYQPN